MTRLSPVAYLLLIASHEAQVERQRILNPIISMKGSIAPAATAGIGEFLVDTTRRRLH